MTQEQLQQIVELGKRATARPWCEELRDRLYVCQGNPQTEKEEHAIALVYRRNGETAEHRRANAGYIAAAANSADILAQQRIELLKLCDEHEKRNSGLIGVSELRKILEEK